jgi:hypothetical protein
MGCKKKKNLSRKINDNVKSHPFVRWGGKEGDCHAFGSQRAKLAGTAKAFPSSLTFSR